ncbi:MAG: ComEC/Rec2 family competence protein [Phycisphaerae bacterium]|jgi:competence protein ComEC
MPEVSSPYTQPGPVPEIRTRGRLLAEWLAAQPLVAPAVGLVAGIGLDGQWPVPFAAAVAAFIAGGVMVFRAAGRTFLGHAGLCLAALSAGTVLHDLSFRHWPGDHLARYCPPEPLPARLIGTVCSTPVIQSVRTGRITWYAQPAHTRLMIQAEELTGTQGPLAVSGLVSVLVREPVLDAAPGDRVELFGTIHRPVPPNNPGELDWPLALRRKGVLVEMSCPHAANVRRLSSSRSFAAVLAAVRRFAVSAMRQDAFEGDVPGGRLLDALVLGQRSAVDPALNQAFVNTGTVHYLSVSGAHVGALMSAVWGLGRLTRRTRRGCALAAIVAVLFYAVLAEPSAAIIRSAVMGCLFCTALLLRRPQRAPNALAAAAILLLIWHPTQLFDPGFQLSFVTLMAVMFLSPRVHAAGRRLLDRLLGRDDPLLQPPVQDLLHPPSRSRRAVRALLRGLGWAFAVSGSAWLAGLLLGAYHFRQIAPWGWLNTVLIIPPMELVLLLGLGKTVLSAIGPGVSALPGRPLERLTEALIAAVNAMDGLPGSGMTAPETPAWLVFLGLGCLAFWIVARPLRIPARWPVLAGAVFTAASLIQLAPRASDRSLRLHVLAAGDGTACVLELPGGQTMLYDLGTRPLYDLQRWTIGPFLAHRRIRSIDALILSHAQLDHFSGVPDLVDRVRVGRIITSPHFLSPGNPTGPARRLLADLTGRGIPWQTLTAGQRLAGTGEVRIDVLWPPPADVLAIPLENDTSLVLRISFGGRRILLCGDIEELAQRRLLAGADLQADVLVLPHHGSVIRTTGAFISAVKPQWCIRSSGQADRETRNGLLELMAGRRYLNTAERGAVEVLIRPGELRVTSFKPPT